MSGPYSGTNIFERLQKRDGFDSAGLYWTVQST